MKQESKIKVLFRNGRIDVVKTEKGEIKVCSDRPGTLRRLMGKRVEILKDRAGYFSKIEEGSVGPLVTGLLN